MRVGFLYFSYSTNKMTNHDMTPKASDNPELLPEMLEIVEILRADPTTPVNCIFGDGPALVVRHMVRGCVALSDKVQPLCRYHEVNRTPMDDDDRLVIDLSIEAVWSRSLGERPFYVILSTTEGLELTRLTD